LDSVQTLYLIQGATAWLFRPGLRPYERPRIDRCQHPQGRRGCHHIIGKSLVQEVPQRHGRGKAHVQHRISGSWA